MISWQLKGSTATPTTLVKQIEQITPADLSQAALEDAMVALGTTTYTLRVGKEQDWCARAVRVVYPEITSLTIEGSMDQDEWAVDKYENGKLVATFHSAGA